MFSPESPESQKLINFFGYDAMTNVFIEKARACSFLPPNFDDLGDLDYYLECQNQANYINWLKTDPQVPAVAKQFALDLKFQKEYDQYIFDLFEFKTPTFFKDRCEYGKIDSEEDRLKQLTLLEDCLNQDSLLKYMGVDVPYRKFFITLKPREQFKNYSTIENGIRSLYQEYVNMTDNIGSKSFYRDLILKISFNDNVDSCIVPELFDFEDTKLSLYIELTSWRERSSSYHAKKIDGDICFHRTKDGLESVGDIKIQLGSVLKLLARG
jgi:hypothetical protein